MKELMITCICQKIFFCFDKELLSILYPPVIFMLINITIIIIKKTSNFIIDCERKHFECELEKCFFFFLLFFSMNHFLFRSLFLFQFHFY
jgi:hypothetical protein